MTLKNSFFMLLLFISSGIGEAAERNYLKIDSLQCASMPRLSAERVTALEARVAMPDAKVGSRRKQQWHLTWGSDSSCMVGLSFDFRNYLDGVSTTAAVASLEVNGLSYKISKDVDLSGGFNSVAIEWNDRDGDVATISVGNKILQEIAEVQLSRPVGEERIRILGNPQSTKVDVCELILETTVVPEQKLATDWDENSLMEHFASDYCTPIEGVWDYMDRENEPRIAQPGGRYRVGIVANGSGGYDIIYMDGAKVNADKWHCGMLKGRLQPTIFTGQYRLEWYDATFEPISTDTYAELSQSALLTLQFPTLSASIRLSKVVTR